MRQCPNAPSQRPPGRFPPSGPVRAYTLHHRFHYDPPEVQTIALFAGSPDGAGEGLGLRAARDNVRHWGYLRDDPAVAPLMVVESDADMGRTFKHVGDTLFAAAHALLLAAQADIDSSSTGSSKGKGKAARAEVGRAIAALEAAAAAGSHALGASAQGAWKARQAAVQGRTLSGLGVCVPYDPKTELGYRPLNVTLK